MRLSFIIGSINRWFARVVFERDVMDEILDECAEQLDEYISWVLVLAQLFVMLSRALLGLLMMVGIFFSGFLMRQMEYDADQYEARLVGNKVFEATSHRLRRLGFSFAKAYEEAYLMFQRGSLADDFGALAMHFDGKIPKEYVLVDPDERTGWFSTHPCDRDRVNYVNRSDNRGVFLVEGRARDLFEHFDVTGKNVTWDFYCETIGQVKKEEMRPVSELLHEQRVREEPALRDEEELAPIPFDDED